MNSEKNFKKRKKRLKQPVVLRESAKWLQRTLPGAVLFFALSACAAPVEFLYPHYGMDFSATCGGQLLAKDPVGDLPLAATCAPTDVEKGKCIVMLRSDFYKMKEDYLDTKQKLIDLQKGL